MDDRTKGIGEGTSGRRDEYVTGRADELPTSRAYDASPTRPDERGSAVADQDSARTSTRQSSTRDPRTHQIRAEIEQTRDNMSETIEAIQDRLRPSNVASNAVSSVRDAATERMHDVADSEFVQDLRANPAPTIMIGIGIVGLAWWAFGREEHTYRDGYRTRSRRRAFGGDYSSDDRFYRNRQWQEDTAAGYSPGLSYTERSGIGTRGSYGTGQDDDTGAASSRFGSEREGGTGDVRARAGEYADSARRTARRTTRRAQSGLQRMLNENPLMMAAAAAAVGAAIGMALPETERENELMGEARDSAVENVQTMARDAAERVQNAATDAAERVQHVASEAVGLAGGSDSERKGTETPSTENRSTSGSNPSDVRPSGTTTPKGKASEGNR